VTLATKITIGRIVLVPVFAVLAVAYGKSVADGQPDPSLRWWALGVFIAAAVSDGLDGWVARRFNQKSKLGAFLDPIADKFLLAVGVIVLSLVDWKVGGWRLPLWFAVIVVFRDSLILIGIRILWNHKCEVKYVPHWVGKVATFTQMFALGWVMLQWLDYSPVWPCAVAGFFTLWSSWVYWRQWATILNESSSKS